MREICLLLPALVALLTACSSQETTSAYTVRDSLGVRIAETVTEAEILAP